ncbi:hypothetical protein HOLleu_26192 [Holothuria leucospilota]|uniref:Uncharacterized protein n=1 Tax=Holothuria leucospilota TaxID=206669 RepID=A0A9Q1H4J3_HOLLE|nr:hypothetical protein HOLleu_26192 [Holothuria leucospilota]
MTEKAKLLSENQEKEQAQLQNEKQQLQQSLESLEKQLKEVLEEKDGLLSAIEEGMQIVQRKEVTMHSISFS